MRPWRGMISSDWNECLAPCGPFDCIAYTYPDLSDQLGCIFRQYTGNEISLGEAVARLTKILPRAISPEQMDTYLQSSFSVYTGLPELVGWCRENDILFMINTTGMIGYFQRMFAGDLLPVVDVLSAHPMVRYPEAGGAPPLVMALYEISDKAVNTAKAADRFGIPADRIIIMGDSGGDGPHFQWGAENGSLLVGSMAKPSLTEYCRENNIRMDVSFGVSYSRGEVRRSTADMAVDFMDLAAVISSFLARR